MKLSVHNVIYNVFVITTALVVLFLAVAFALGARGFVVMSNSMTPMFSRGDVVFTRPIRFEDLQEDDVITAYFPESKDSVFTHRIIRVDSAHRCVYTRGDSNMQDDPMATEESNIIGMYWFCVPNLGFVSLELGNYIIYIALAIAIVLILLRFLLPVFRKKKR